MEVPIERLAKKKNTKETVFLSIDLEQNASPKIKNNNQILRHITLMFYNKSLKGDDIPYIALFDQGADSICTYRRDLVTNVR